MPDTLTQIKDDLYQTRTDSPLPGLTTHAYLWRRPTGNVLFYSPATDADFDDIAELGGVAAQYLSHLDEAGSNLARIKDRFGSRLHAAAAEVETIERYATVDAPIGSRRHLDANGVEVIPTPGHSVGSNCYLVTIADGTKVLFTGDTIFPAGDGAWGTFLVPGRSDAGQLESSVELLRAVAPDVVISSAFGGETAIETVNAARWAEILDQAHASVAVQTA